MGDKNRITNVIKRDGRIVPFDAEKIVNAVFGAALEVGGHDRQLSEQIARKVVRLLNEYYTPPHIPLVEEVQDVIEKVLIENGHARTAKAFILYRDYRKRERHRKSERSGKETSLPYRMILETLIWNLDHNCATTTKLNQHIRAGSFPELVSDANRVYDDSIRAAAEAVAAERQNLRIIIVAGPSSSGKSTTTAKLSANLNRLGIHTVPLNLDHYFFDLELHPKDEHGDYDFEQPVALDIALINNHLSRLVRGETVRLPRYDFGAGKRYDDGEIVTIQPDQVILLDTLHGLYEPLTRSVENNMKYKIYIETIAQLRDSQGQWVRWADIRLLRRMVRDNATRGYAPMQTVGHWHYVRRSELKHIIPMIHSVDYVLNGSLPYELPYMKKHLFQYLPAFIEAWKDDSTRRDAYVRAERIYKLLSEIDQYDDESILPQDCLIREFIGGSVLKLH
ncbi:MAG: ATP cone domain-containing protein [Candidatus Neomarinimicrobiota bacterium]